MKLPPDWSEFIGLLCSHHVRFLIVGAHALAANGRPRATQDLDIWVQPTVANAKRLSKALADFGFTALSKQVTEFSMPDRMATLGRPPLQIDIMTSVTGVAFARAYQHRLVARFGRHAVGFLGQPELLVNKLASGRPKDLADVALLLEGKTTATQISPVPVRRGR
jgi:hypothetical protein